MGGLAFVVDVGLFQLLYAGLRLDAVLAKGTATLVAMSVAYAGHRHWSFADRARLRHRQSYPRFALVNAVTLAMGLAIVWFVRHPLDVTSAVTLQGANVLSIAVGTVVRYLAYRGWVFPAGSPPTDEVVIGLAHTAAVR